MFGGRFKFLLVESCKRWLVESFQAMVGRRYRVMVG